MNTHQQLRRRGYAVKIASIAIALALAAGLTACGKANSENPTEAPEIGVRVSVDRPITRDALRVVRVNGGITADRQVTVLSIVSGRIVSLPTHLGASVADSQIIAVVDYSTLDLAVRQARSALAAAEEQAANLATEYQRIERLYRERGVSQQQYDALRTQKRAADEGVIQARTGLQQALETRDEANVRAPFRGVIGRLNVEVGDMVGPSVPIAVVVDQTPLIARVQIPERDIGLVSEGQSAAVSVAAYPTETFEGTVRRISPIIDAVTRMGEVEILLPNTDERLKSGMFATVEIEVDRHSDVLMVSSDAIVQEASLGAEDFSGNVTRSYYVYVKRGDRARRVDVQLGYTTGNNVEIASGLAATDSIVVLGQHLLQDGTLIELTEQGR